MRNNLGFSAFEVAIALAIMAIIAAFVMPNYLNWLRSYRLNGATTNLVADLEMAKIRAVRENAFVAVQFFADRYEIYVDNGAGLNAGNYNRDADERLLRDRDLPNGVSIDLVNVTFDLNRTRFNGRGIPPDITNPETVPLTNSSDTKQITINRLGYMNVQ